MKLFNLEVGFLSFSLLGLSNATVWLEPMPPAISVGDVRNITWKSDRRYNFEMLLVRELGSGWEPIHTIFRDQELAAGNHSYTWTVPDVDPVAPYALHVAGTNVPRDSMGYSNSTDWFMIQGGSETVVSPEVCDGCGNNHGRWAGKVAGAVIGTAIGLCLIGWGLFVLLKRRRAQKSAPRSVHDGHGARDFVKAFDDDDSIVDVRSEAVYGPPEKHSKL